MTTIVNTNTKALFAQQAQTLNQRTLDHAMGQLATGRRINSAADDAAGVAISARMAAQVSSLGQAVRNANDGISMLQTADGAAQAVTDILHRMKELTVQYLHGTNSSEQRGYLADEFSGLTARLSDIISDTTWNGHSVLALAGGSVTFAVGSESADTHTVNFENFSSNASISAASALNLSTGSGSALSGISDALDAVNGARAEWGAAMNVLAFRADNASNVAMNLSASNSRIADADYAQATADMARAQIVQQAGTAMLSQANQLPYLVMALLR
jgi:flagellin